MRDRRRTPNTNSSAPPADTTADLKQVAGASKRTIGEQGMASGKLKSTAVTHREKPSLSQRSVVRDASCEKMMSLQHAHQQLRKIPSCPVFGNEHALHRDNPLGGPVAGQFMPGTEAWQLHEAAVPPLRPA